MIWRTSAEADKPHLVRQQTQKIVTAMFWGYISYNGIGPLVAVDGTMNSSKYIEIIQNHLLPTLAERDVIFMDDNAPCHRSHSVRSFFDENGITRSEWPPQSPDLNPIENLWKYIKDNLKKSGKIISSNAELIAEVSRLWDTITQDRVRRLYDSLPRRLTEVLRMGGNITKYLD